MDNITIQRKIICRLFDYNYIKSYISYDNEPLKDIPHIILYPSNYCLNGKCIYYVSIYYPKMNNIDNRGILNEIIENFNNSFDNNDIRWEGTNEKLIILQYEKFACFRFKLVFVDCEYFQQFIPKKHIK